MLLSRQVESSTATRASRIGARYQVTHLPPVQPRPSDHLHNDTCLWTPHRVSQPQGASNP